MPATSVPSAFMVLGTLCCKEDVPVGGQPLAALASEAVRVVVPGRFRACQPGAL